MSEQKSLPPAILIMGPTATGKTDLAMAISDKLDCELISVDSVMVYRDMNIGSAKPDAETLARYPHHLIDIRDPANPYSAADFRDDALSIMAQATQDQRIPLLVGGTMLYYKSLLQGIADMPGANQSLRDGIMADADRLGWPALHERLQKLDPVAAEKIHPNNRQRIQRALEVCLATGKPFSSHWAQGETTEDGNMITNCPYQTIVLGLVPESREELHLRIESRFDQMLQQGFIDEVKKLYTRGDLTSDLPAIRAVGYRQVWQYLAGELDYEEMVFRGKVATRQLAKRQLTWLRSWPNVNWLTAGSQNIVDQALSITCSQLQSCNSL